MSNFVQFLALWAVAAGLGIAFGAGVRLAFDAWESWARAGLTRDDLVRTRAMWDRLGWSEDWEHPSMDVYDQADR